MPSIPTQREMDFTEAQRVREEKLGAERDSEAIDEMIAGPLERKGHKHFAARLGLGIDKVDRVYHWQERRNGQRVPAEMLLEACREDTGTMASFCELAGYETPAKLVLLTPEEQVRRLKAALREFGPEGEKKIQRAMEAPIAPAAVPEWEVTTPAVRRG